MNIFQIKKTKYIAREFTSWLRTLAIIFLLAFASEFLHLTSGVPWVLVIVLLLLKLGDTVTQYHVHKITVDTVANKVEVILLSVMSGERTLNYSLDKVESQLVRNNGLRRLLSGSMMLEINTSERRCFRVTRRYGFSENSLKTIHHLIQESK